MNFTVIQHTRSMILDTRYQNFLSLNNLAVYTFYYRTMDCATLDNQILKSGLNHITLTIL